MVQKELQIEFQQLIKEISKEVLELSVSKSMENASYTVKEQVPVLSENILQLRKALESLQWVSSELTKHQKDSKTRETRVDSQLKTILQKVEVDIKKVQEVQDDLSSFREDTHKKFLNQEKAVKYTEDITIRESGKLEGKIKELHQLTDGGVLIGTKTKKLLIWTLIFSLGSFGILTTILLHTLKVITL